MKFYRDQSGREMLLNDTPRKIISLVPSQTELLFDLGLADAVAGITKFCVHPQEGFRSKPRVGGTKTVDIEKVKSLQPDLIIANKEENLKKQIEALSSIAPVWVSDVDTVDTACSMITSIGAITGTDIVAASMIQQIREGFTTLRKHVWPLAPRVLYLIWRDPYMIVGSDTFIHDVLEHCGFTNCVAAQKRYPSITVEEMRQLKPDVVLLSSEPYPFKEKHIAEIQTLLPAAHIELVDGEMFSWYGSRMLQAVPYLKRLQQSLSNSISTSL
jgi:ABC-type Fe3+-hydroxamate transport system substrate-binding protein